MIAHVTRFCLFIIILLFYLDRNAHFLFVYSTLLWPFRRICERRYIFLLLRWCRLERGLEWGSPGKCLSRWNRQLFKFHLRWGCISFSWRGWIQELLVDARTVIYLVWIFDWNGAGDHCPSLLNWHVNVTLSKIFRWVISSYEVFVLDIEADLVLLNLFLSRLI